MMVMAQIHFSLKGKIKMGRPEHSLIVHPAMSDNISFLPYQPPPPQSGRYIFITQYLTCPYLEK